MTAEGEPATRILHRVLWGLGLASFGALLAVWNTADWIAAAAVGVVLLWVIGSML